MSALRVFLATMFSFAVLAVPSPAALIVSIDNIVVTGTGGQFDVKVSATAGSVHEIDAYGLKLNATQFGGSVSPITITSESNLVSGFTVLDFNANNSISATNAASNGLPATPNTVGYNAANLSGFLTLDATDANPNNDMASFGRFMFTVGGDGSFDVGEFWDVGFVTANPGVDTGFARSAVNIAYSAVGARIAAVPEPSAAALLGIVGVAAQLWRRRKGSKKDSLAAAT